MFKVFDTDVYFSSYHAELKKRNGERIKALDILPPTEYDILDVGVMFNVKLEDDTTIVAFKDEVSIDILSYPDMYADEHTDYEFAQIESENYSGGLVRFLIGVNDEGEYYLTIEDDDTAEDYFIGQDGESFEEIFYEILKNIVLGR